jgi:hypothetical protein
LENFEMASIAGLSAGIKPWIGMLGTHGRLRITQSEESIHVTWTRGAFARVFIVLWCLIVVFADLLVIAHPPALRTLSAGQLAGHGVLVLLTVIVAAMADSAIFRVRALVITRQGITFLKGDRELRSLPPAKIHSLTSETLDQWVGSPEGGGWGEMRQHHLMANIVDGSKHCLCITSRSKELDRLRIDAGRLLNLAA